MPERNFTDEDLVRLSSLLTDHWDHPCRFSDINHDDMQEAVKAIKAFNRMAAESKSTARKTIIVILITLASSLVTGGIVMQVKSIMGSD